MVDVAFSVGRLLVAFFLVALNGFFVASEFAFVRIRSTSVDRLVEEGKTGATILREALDNLDDYLAVTQLGITIASLGLGWIGEPAVAALIEPLLESVLPASAIHLAAFAIGFGFITFLHVVFGELAPKTIAIQEAERIALLVAAPMKAFYYLFVPGIIVFNGTANFFTRLVGVSPASESEETLSEEEILMVLSRSGQQGAVDASEVEMIERVFELDDTPVREVMIPRPDVVTVPADLPLSDLRSTVLETGHTRYPVLNEENGDRVVGFLDVKDVLRVVESLDRGGEGRDDAASETGVETESGEGVTAGDLAREVTIVPETTRIDDLLAQFQADHSQMAAVIDEWGSFEGIATVEDVLEELVGDLRDEFDRDEREPSIERIDEGTFEIDGGLALATVNEALGSEFESREVETIGGLVLARLDRAPEAGDRVTIDGYEARVEAVDGARISSVVVREPSESSESPEIEADPTSEPSSEPASTTEPEPGSETGSGPSSDPE